MDFALQELTLQSRRWSGDKCCDGIYGHVGEEHPALSECLLWKPKVSVESPRKSGGRI